MHTLEYHHANSSILKRTTSINFIAFLNFFLHFKYHENDQMWPRLSLEVQAVDIDIIQQFSGPWRNISSLPSSKVFSKNDEAEISSGPNLRDFISLSFQVYVFSQMYTNHFIVPPAGVPFSDIKYFQRRQSCLSEICFGVFPVK